MNPDTHSLLLMFWFGLSVVAFLVLQFLSAPYGRHERAGWGPTIPARVGWVGMELPALIVPLIVCLLVAEAPTVASWTFLAFWVLHYAQRTLVFPFRMRVGNKRMPFLVAALAAATNVLVSTAIGFEIYVLAPLKPAEWLMTPQFLLGAVLFLTGFAFNLQSDEILRNLRKPGETGYKIPAGGLFRWVSAPNYLAEIVEWVGFAILTDATSAWLFVVWTLANLVPRASTNHRWYLERFPDYPARRRALLPFVW